MFHISLFTLLAIGVGLFAFAAAGAHLFLIAIPAAVLALWFLDLAYRSYHRWRAARRQREPSAKRHRETRYHS